MLRSHVFADLLASGYDDARDMARTYFANFATHTDYIRISEQTVFIHFDDSSVHEIPMEQYTEFRGW